MVKKRSTDPAAAVSAPKMADVLNEELLIEWNLLRILGMYFCLDNKKASTLTSVQEFNEKVVSSNETTHHTVRIMPNAGYGYPSIGALRVFFAIVRKFIDQGYPIPEGIKFSQRELLKLVGSRSGGFQNKQLANYLLQLRSTIVESRRYDKKTGEWFMRPFSLISDMYLSGKKQHLDHCYVELDKDLYESINAFYGLRIFYHRLDPLPPTVKILYINLFNSFGIVFRKTNKVKNLYYNKDYETLIAEWLPHFKVLSYASDIKKDQLGKHLDVLCDQGLLKSWEIKKSTKNDGFTLYFHPGVTFFDDYQRIQSDRNPQLRLAFDNPDTKKPYGEERKLLTYYFSKLHHSDESSVPDIFTENDRTFAEVVLRQLSLDDAKEFVDFALDKEAPKTNFKPILFKGIEQYYLKFLSSQKERQQEQKIRASRRALEKEEELRNEYDIFWKKTVELIKEQLPKDELQKQEQEATDEVKNEGVHHFMIKTIVRLRVNQKIAVKYSLPEFEVWRNSKITPDEFTRSLPKL